VRGVERRVVVLLRTLNDARQAWDVRSGGDGVLLMPSMYREGSYVELERVLRVMRDSTGHDVRQMWWNVSARFIWVQRRLVTVHVSRSRKGPVPQVPPFSELETVVDLQGNEARIRLSCWNDRVADELVERGVSWIADSMFDGDPGRVVLPAELRGLVESRSAFAS
jgi:hypothetical protein